ncbi:LacI family DNA-binding transcriptional regulator [Agromyces sp. MMS24-K17]|uniref:LacI family DNA-binding transcriptional regulator n=1 Tax=Agromyces sp. MMS24-K17 TaxID=3372850 RepID=UPI003754BCFF
MPGRRVTMKEVARASGVSPATVSFVLNDRPDQTIPEATRERVRAAAAELGYVPHGVARALREGASRIVVLNVARMPHGRGSLAAFIDGLDAELGRHGHTLLVRYRAGNDDVAQLVTTISPRAVLDLDRIYFDDAEGGADTPSGDSGDAVADGGWTDGIAAHTAVQVRHLAERGHRTIAMAVPDDAALGRLAALRIGYARRAAADLGIDPVELLGLTATPDGDADASALAGVLEAHPAVTAVAALDDDTALRVLGAAAALGIAVPDRLAVIGFDDTGHGALWRPALTTLRIDAAAFGRRAARTLLGLPAGDADPGPAVVVQRATT